MNSIIRTLSGLFVLTASLSVAAETTITVTGVVYHDANADGRRDDGEPGLAGVMVSDGETLRRTDADGAYTFRFTVAENRFVFVVRPTGYRLTTPFARRFAPDKAASADTVHFGLAKDPSAGRRDRSG